MNNPDKNLQSIIEMITQEPFNHVKCGLVEIVDNSDIYEKYLDKVINKK